MPTLAIPNGYFQIGDRQIEGAYEYLTRSDPGRVFFQSLLDGTLTPLIDTMEKPFSWERTPDFHVLKGFKKGNKAILMLRITTEDSRDANKGTVEIKTGGGKWHLFELGSTVRLIIPFHAYPPPP